MTDIKAEPGVRERIAAAEIVARWLSRGLYPERLVRAEENVSRFLTELVAGTVRWRRTLEWITGRYLRRRPSRALQACLMTGVYQMFFMDSVPDYAAVSTVTAAARHFAGEGGARLVNAVLRRVQNDRAIIWKELEQQPPPIRLSHPDHLWRRWAARWGEESAEALCVWNNQRPYLTLRVRTSRTSLCGFLERLKRHSIDAEPHPFSPDEFLLLRSQGAISLLPGYQRGEFVVQDPSARVAVDLLDPQSGERILDACAAPGGKTIMIADRTGGRAQITAVDRYEDRMKVLKANLTRCGLSGIALFQLDLTSARAGEWLKEGAFDRVLLDVPCTNTGVIRKHPDVKWSWSESRLRRTLLLQERLLDAVARTVASGGRLVYSTCSLEVEENQKMVEKFLAAHSDFALEEIRSTFPPETQTDGVFAAAMKRRP